MATKISNVKQVFYFSNKVQEICITCCFEYFFLSQTCKIVIASCEKIYGKVSLLCYHFYLNWEKSDNIF